MNSVPHIKKGSVDLCYVFEIGEAVNLNKAGALIEEDTRRQLSGKRGAHERYFGYDPAPLISSEVSDPFIFNNVSTDRSFELTIFDIGVVFARYKIHLPEGMPLRDLVQLGILLGEDVRLPLDACSRVDAMLNRIKSAVINPSLEDINHSYFLFGIESLEEAAIDNLPHFINQNGGVIAQILRQDSQELSQDIISDALKYRISYAPTDITIIDWDGAIRFGKESRDIFGVIEFSLVQLLEMLYLDEKIDDHNDDAYEAFSSYQRKGALMKFASYLSNTLTGKFKTTEAELAQLAVDSTNLAISVSSAINLIGDPTLVKIYELASERFRLLDLERAIDRKIGVLEGIYQKYTDRANARRSTILELVIIILIAIEVYQSLSG
ncbi:MAG TPA: hypothetical protein PKA63_11905 [Oligoflexia bacterium]|nr:hypothetical protein [Oligoflexia bacterium]HMP49358.1 hypothetical protein [Oligoflexia bacterium]